jgi:hypothetical protein
MNMTMIEKVARVLMKVDQPNNWEECDWEIWVEPAKAAIEAMREPNVPSNLEDKWDDFGQWFWNQMIDAALEGK